MALALERAFGVIARFRDRGMGRGRRRSAELTKRAATIAEIESSSVSAVSNISPSSMMKQLSELSEISSPRIGAQSIPSPSHFPSHLSQPGLGGHLGPSEGVSQVSTISVSHSSRVGAEHEARERRLRVPLMVLLAATMALAAAVGVVLALNRTPAGSGPKSFAHGAPTGDGVPASPSAPTSPTGMTTPEPPATAASAEPSSPVPSVVASPTSPPTSEATPTPPPPPSPSPHKPADPPPAPPGRGKRVNVTDPGSRVAPKGEGKKASAAAAANCDPPYTVDDQGHKMYKMECLSQ